MGSHANSTEEINSYLETLWLETFSGKHLTAYRRDLTDTANLLQALGINQISAAGEGDLLEVLNDRQASASPRSTARWLSTKGFYRHLVLQQKIVVDPTHQIHHPKLLLPTQCPETDQVEALLTRQMSIRRWALGSSYAEILCKRAAHYRTGHPRTDQCKSTPGCHSRHGQGDKALGPYWRGGVGLAGPIPSRCPPELASGRAHAVSQ